MLKILRSMLMLILKEHLHFLLNTYELKLNLLDKVDAEDIGLRNIFCVLEKRWWTRLLRGNEKTPHYVKVDWDKWVVDEDDDTGAPADFDMGGMDFSKFGGMGGLGDDGMGDDFDDSDDEVFRSCILFRARRHKGLLWLCWYQMYHFTMHFCYVGREK